MVNSSFFTDGPVNEGLAIAPPAPAAFYADPAAAASSAQQAADAAATAAASASAASTAAAAAVAAVIGKANVDSPTFTGVPAAPTPSNGDNSTRLATTAWVQANAVGSSPATATPVMDGTATVGVSAKYAREDHVHPTDTSRASVAYVNSQIATVATVSYVDTQDATKAPLASPALTGAPTAPTPTSGDNSTKIATTAYVTTALTPYRTALAANTTYYVRTDGSDSNTGLSNTSGGAFLTIAKALTVAGAIDCLSYQLTISVQAGAYTAPVSLPRVVGALPPILTGVGSTTFISVTGTSPAVQNVGGTPWIVQNMKLASTGGDGLHTELGGTIQFQGIEFGACGGNAHIIAFSQSSIKCIGNYSISGSASTHYQGVGYVDVASITVTFLANVSFTQFASATSVGYIRAWGNTYSLGAFAVSGQRYLAQANSVLFTNSAGATYFPGSTAGATATGGLYI
jgi:hypothetical protein